MRRKGCSAQGLLHMIVAARAALFIYEPPAEPAPYGRRRRLTVPLTIFCKRHGRLRPLPRHFDRAFGVFFAKGTVGRDPCPAISTVPLAFFYKRHGRLRPLPRHFDRAFDAFLQKARSVAPSSPPFRPCLCPFFAKGTVGRDPCPAISTVPLTIFCERHGRSYPLPRNFDRAFGVFLQKARSAATPAPRFRPCL